jgi:filamentous hemagglutinin
MGGFITLVSTESGAGVRHEGLIRSARNIAISANGDVTLNHLSAGNDIAVQGHAVTVDTATASRNVTLNSEASLQANAVTAGGNTQLRSWDAIKLGDGQTGNGLSTGGLLDMKARNGIVISNDVQADRVKAEADSVSIQGATVHAIGAQLTGTENAISIVANELTLSGAMHALTQGGQTVPPDQPVVIHEGQVQALQPDGKHEAGVKLVTTAMLKSGGGIDISAKRLNNEGGVIEDTSNRGISITSDNFRNEGLVQSHGDIRVTAETLSNLCFAGAAVGGVNQTICGGFIAGGLGDFNIGVLTNQGGLVANQSLSLVLGTGAHTSGVHGEISGTQGLNITQAPGQQASLHNAGNLTSGGDINVAIDGLVSTSGSQISSAGNIDLQIDKTLETGAALRSNKALSMSAQDLRTTATSTILSGERGTLTATRNLTNERGSTISIARDLLMTAGEDLTTGAQINVRGPSTTLEAQGQLVNAEGTIISTTNLVMKSGGSLTNENGAIISVDDSLVMESAGDISNLSGSVVTSEKTMALTARGTLRNDGGSMIEARQLDIDAKNLFNNDGAHIGGVEALTIKASDQLRNEAGAAIQGDQFATLTAGGTLTNNNALITAGELVLNGKHVTNSNRGEITADTVQANAQGTFTSQSGATLHADNVFIDANRFNASASNILANNHLDLSIREFFNTATAHSKNTATVTMKDGTSLVIGAGQHSPTADNTLNIYTHNLTVDGSLRNPGAIEVDATGSVLNNGEIISGRWLDLIAEGAIDNQANKLIWSAEEMLLDAGTTITNWQNGLIRAAGDLTMIADKAVINEAGRIDAGGDVAIDTALLENRSEIQGELKTDGLVHTNNWYTEAWMAWDTEYFNTQFWTQRFSPEDLLVKQGVISAGGDLLLNQDSAKGKKASVRNLGGLMAAAGDIKIDGNLENLGSKKGVSLIDYLKDSSAYARWSVSESTYSDGPILNANLYDLFDKNLLYTDAHVLLNELQADRQARLDELNRAWNDEKASFKPILTEADAKEDKILLASLISRQQSLFEAELAKKYDPMNAAVKAEFAAEEKRLTDEVRNMGLSSGPTIYGNDKWMYSLRKTATPEGNALMSAVFGADWKNLNHAAMRKRWVAFKASPDQTLDFYADKQAEISAGQDFAHTGGSLTNGTGANWGKNRTVDVQIGDEHLVTVQGELDAVFNRDSAFDLKGNDYLPALRDAINSANAMQDLISNNPLFTANVNLADTSSNVDGVAGKATSDFQGVSPLYTSRVSFKQDDFYGSQYLFDKIGYDPQKTVTVLGDAYFDNELIVRTIEKTLGNFFAQRQLSGPTLVQNLLDNAANEAAKLGLVIGQPLTQQQYEQLGSDIVWYEPQVVDGITVLAPKLYVSKSTLLARQYDQNNGGLIAAQNVLIDATAVNNVNGVIRGSNDTLVYSETDINNVSQGGTNTGIHGGEHGRLTVAAEGKVHNQGGNMQGFEQTVVGDEGVTSTATTGFNEKGNLEVRNNGIFGVGLTLTDKADDSAAPKADSGVAAATADSDVKTQPAPTTTVAEAPPMAPVAKPDVRAIFENAKQQSAAGAVADNAVSSVSVISGGDLNLIGAHTIANNVNLQATGDLNMKDIHEVKSDFTSSTDHGFLSHQTTRVTTSSATSKGNEINTDNLTINVGGNWNVTGSNVNAQNSDVKVVGDTTVAAGKNAASYEKVQKTVQWVAGASTGSNGHETSDESTLFSTQKAPTGASAFEYSDQDLAEHTGATSGANKNRGNTVGARYRYGIEIVETKETIQDTTHSNAQLNLGSGTMLVGGTFDLGGADINAEHLLSAEERAKMNGDELAAAMAAMPSLDIRAGAIKSTKFEDTHKQTFSREETFVGVDHETHSSIASVVTNINRTADKGNDGMEVDGALTAAAQAGNITQVVFSDTVGMSINFGATHTKTKSESQSATENINLIGGNIGLTTSTGDIDLNGVSIQGGRVALDSAGAINQRAAQSSSSGKSSTDIHSAAFSVAGSVSPMGVGIGASLGASGSYDRTEESATHYTNGTISGANVDIRAKGDHSMEGATIQASTLNYAIDGTQTITSRQDVSNKDHERGSWSAAGGVAISTTGGLVPTGSGSTSGGKDYDNSTLTTQQSGIKADSMNMHVGGDQKLAGAHIINTSGEGSYRVDGTLTATNLADTRDKDGGYGGGGGGMSKSGLPTVVVETGRVDQVKYDATQKATIDLGGMNMNVGGGVTGSVNRDAKALLDVTQDRKIAGTDIKVEISMADLKKKKADAPTAKHVENDLTIDIPSAPHVNIDKTITIETVRQVDNDKTITIETVRQVDDDLTIKGPTTTDVAVTKPGPGKTTDTNARHMTAATTGTQLKNALAKLNSPNREDQAALKRNPVAVTIRDADGKLTTHQIKDADSLKALDGKQVVTGERAEYVNPGSGLGQSSTLYIKVVPQPGGGFTTTFTPTPPKPL